MKISKAENGDQVIHSVPEDRGAALLEALASFTDDYVAILEEEQANQPQSPIG